MKETDEEIQAIKKNSFWELSSLPKGQKAIGVKWVFKTKKNVEGEVERNKARLVAKDYAQRQGVDRTTTKKYKEITFVMI